MVLTKEYRICMPMTVEEYQSGQIYMIARHSFEQSSNGEGVEVVANEQVVDQIYGHGQHTEKRIHLSSHLPYWLQSLIPKVFYVTEKACNYYPYTTTDVKIADTAVLPATPAILTLPACMLLLHASFKGSQVVFSHLLIAYDAKSNAQSIEQVLGGTIPEVRAIFHARPHLRLIQQAQLLVREKAPHLVQDSELITLRLVCVAVESLIQRISTEQL
ncbi:hypothetical protein evm_003810 [Chilo suppressalis]|nr:hypothetical protein evm_003810 [Chilo suppressalis]